MRRPYRKPGSPLTTAERHLAFTLSVFVSPVCRHLTPEMLTWVAKTGRFLFHKDTTLEVPAMLRKLEAVRAVPETPLK